MNIFENMPEEEIKKRLGNALKRRRTFLGLTQTDIANQLGYKSINFISLLEKGSKRIPVSMIELIAEAYMFDLSVFGQLVLMSLYPDVWSLMTRMIELNPQFNDKENITEDELDELLLRSPMTGLKEL